MIRRAAPIGIALLGLLACDAQTDPGYQGEPLVTLRGQVESSSALPPLEAAILWQRGPPPGTEDQELATLAPVTSGFPAGFTLRLYTPPPEAAFQTLAPGAPRFARANAAAVPYGVSAAQVATLPAVYPASYTFDAEHWVVYVESDVPANSLTEWWLGGALAKGYHLVRVVQTGCPTAADLQSCAADLVRRGVVDNLTPTAGTARGFCTATNRLQPTTRDDPIVLHLGQVAPPAPACP